MKYDAIAEAYVKSKHPMIMVDGEQKPEHNSEGQPIHHTYEGIANFHRWFSGSKMADNHGRPIPFYHGTSADIDKFSLAHVGKGTDQFGSGFYFTNKPDVASNYAAMGKENQNVSKVYLRINKPIDPKDEKPLTSAHIKKLIMSAPDHEESLQNFGDIAYSGYQKVLNDAVISYSEQSKFHAINMLSNDFYKGHEGHFLTNVKKITGHDGVVSTEPNGHVIVAAFSPKSIKSATGNSGDFSFESENINEDAK
jgi:ADP-Ribosyltransferase in polyvalent proteins